MLELRHIALRAAAAVDDPTHRAAFAAARAGALAEAGLPAVVVDELLSLQYRAMQAQYLRSWPAAECVTVLVDEQAAGRLVLDRQPGEVRLVDIALLPQYQGRGVGSEVLGRLLDAAAAADELVVLQVARDNLGARRLYARLGFREVSAGDRLYVEMEWRGPPLRSGGAASRAETIRTSRGVQAS